jgi:hypothetical protein
MREQVINADGTRRDIAPANGTDYSLRELQAVVGGFIELVTLDDRWMMVVNEEGMLQDLQLNATASYLAQRPIVGNVALVRQGSVK